MALKISNNEVITNARKGQFTSLNPGVYTSPPGSPSTGDFIYNSSTQQIQVYNGSTWV